METGLESLDVGCIDVLLTLWASGRLQGSLGRCVLRTAPFVIIALWNIADDRTDPYEA